jgi:TIR domain
MDKSEIKRLQTDFFGRDPVLGERALRTALADSPEVALSILVPMEGGFGCPAYQVEHRLARLAAATEAQSVDYLLGVIREGSWHSGSSAAPAFAGLRNAQTRAQQGLAGILKQGKIDSQRHAIEALGFLGASDFAFDIPKFAQYHQWMPQEARFAGPSAYAMEKLYYNAVQALIRMTAPLTGADDIGRCLRALRDFLPVCEETLGDGRPSIWDIRNVRHHFPARAADPITETWIQGDSQLLQECGVEALGHIRLNRTVDLLLDVLENQAFSDSVRQSASISVSQFATGVAAAQLAKRLDRVREAPETLWAFAALYAHDAPWPQCDRLVEAALALHDSEIAAHMIYSLACRGDPQAEHCFSALNARQSHWRGCNALACARFDAPRAREALLGRDEEAGNPLEHVCILAAQVHAGETAKIDLLHQALAAFPELPLLRPIWKREVLYAFFVAEGEWSERGRLWCEAAVERQDRVSMEMAQLLKRQMGKPRQPTAPAQASPLAQPAQIRPEQYDVFISHASEDKAEIAEPLYRGLVAAGVRVWFDKTEIKLGDRLRRKIDDGLARCRFGVVIVSPNFLAKQWPQNELDGLMARETASGEKAILPVWHNLGAAELVKAAPVLADRVACRSSEGIDSIVKKILEALKD